MKILMVLLLLFLISFFWIHCKQSTGNKELTEKQKESYLKKGQDITSSTFLTLSSQLQQALNSGGVPNAIQYCKTAAYPLTDSLSELHNAQIRRTSLKVRNQKNEPDSLERSILMEYESQSSAGAELNPVVTKLDDGTVAYFAPIRAQGLCLSCHGVVGNNLTTVNDSLIKVHYPGDKATGYQLGDLRGVLSIKFAD